MTAPTTTTSTSMEVVIEAETVSAGLRRVMERLAPDSVMLYLHEIMVPFLRDRAENRFRSEGDDAAGQWKPLSQSTQDIRAAGRQAGLWAVGDAHPINVRTHEMEQHILTGKGDTIPDGAGALLLFPGGSPSSAVQEKITTAQRGSSKTGAPPRRVLAVSETDAAFALTELEHFILRGWTQ